MKHKKREHMKSWLDPICSCDSFDGNLAVKADQRENYYFFYVVLTNGYLCSSSAVIGEYVSNRALSSK